MEMPGNIKVTKNATYCGVPQCKTYQTSTISMHKLPKRVLDNPRELLKWQRVLRMGKPFPKCFRMCSLHFEPNKIISPINRGQLKRSLLVDTAFPTLNLPKSSISTKKCIATIKARYERLKNRTLRKEFGSDFRTGPTRGVATDIEDLIPCASIGTQASISQEDKSTQVNELDLKPLSFSCNKTTQVYEQYVQPFPFCCDRDDQLKIATGIPTHALLEEFVTMCESIQPTDHGNAGMCLKARIFLTMYKLKHKLSNAITAVTFEISTKTTKKYFLETMQLLAKANVIKTYRHIFEKIK